MSRGIEWTPERLEALCALFAEGLSMSKIGLKLGLSKNAICGKCDRLDLRRGRHQHGGKQKPRSMARSTPKPPYISPPPSPSEPEPIAPPVTMFTVASNQCRWPIGDPADVQFRFCGHETGGPVETHVYCSFHANVAFAKDATARANARARSKAA